MNENLFFREVTLRICSSLNLQRAAERTLAYIRGVLPADCLHMALYDPDVNVLRILAHVCPDHWPRVPATLPVPKGAMARILQSWRSEAKFGVLNSLRNEDPEIRKLLGLLFPEVSLLHTDLELEQHRIGVLVLAAEGEGRYREEQSRLMNLLNEPFSIAMANTLQHQETVRLKEMLEDDNRYLSKELRHASGDTIIGADFGLKGVMQMIRQVAPLDSPVLLLGETGTGKELLANALHAASPRRDGPFVKVNCGGLPESLLDSELFGHEKGAFTGASALKRGRFERANGGTLFLDEIGELALAAQVKLLRVLQHGEIERVGGTQTVTVDVRVISATHRNLEEMVARGQFREDLWYRLNVFPIMIPPLRQRPQDIPALVDFLISRKSREMKIAKKVRLSPELRDQLSRYAWPGNVRELQNLVERLLIQGRTTASGELLLDPGVAEIGLSETSRRTDVPSEEILPFDTAVSLFIIKALERSGGKVIGPGGAAERLGLHPSTLRGKMRKLKISKNAGQI
ncbi:MAG: AAA family ATPase [Desulfobacteraceae bacterium]|nr:MAG: AAA family ATPase [Desulfobacteraceae bacterium]